ncbi:MAG: class I SAM-dependent methyltransferase [Oscillospiraceae bacterium]|jgi:SAM-dependent methyltransferase|nr:class I SAM-dependent methyltransferase [Oscillospiraceae bacterium]
MGESDGAFNLREYFEGQWASRSRPGKSAVSAETWDERAEEWIRGIESGGKQNMLERVGTTSAYLRGRGLLGAGDSVADVGCGPGLFVAEFAESAKYALGIDFSRRFVEYGREICAARGLTNTSFRAEDFLTFDIDAAGLVGQFDLVFTSITPASTGRGCLDKLIRMSRAFCCNCSFANTSDSLTPRVMREVFGSTSPSRFSGDGFYALVNLLWHRGYYPETYYYADERSETYAPTLRDAQRLADLCGRESDDDTAKVLQWLERNGAATRESVYRYGFILWDTRVRDER